MASLAPRAAGVGVAAGAPDCAATEATGAAGVATGAAPRAGVAGIGAEALEEAAADVVDGWAAGAVAVAAAGGALGLFTTQTTKPFSSILYDSTVSSSFKILPRCGGRHKG